MGSFFVSVQSILKRFVKNALRRDPVAGAAANLIVIGYLTILVQFVCLTMVGIVHDLTSVTSLSSAALVGVSFLVYGASDLVFERNRSLAIRLRLLSGLTIVLGGIWALVWAGLFVL